MGFGFGAGADMQKTYHANIGNLKSKNSFKELRKQYQEKPKKQFKYNKMDPETYKVWKTKLADQLKKRAINSPVNRCHYISSWIGVFNSNYDLALVNHML